MKTVRWILVIGVICGATLMAGYRLSQSELNASAAVPDPVPAKASLSTQATTLQEVEARPAQPVADRTTVFENIAFGYRVNYPFAWEKVELSDYVVSFRSPDGLTQVKVEAVGSLPADGLSQFVDRSLGSSEVILSRQQLTVHNLPAERVVIFSKAIDSQVTTFYINADNSAFVVTGVGQQRPIEMIARSFNAPQLVAQR